MKFKVALLLVVLLLVAGCSSHDPSGHLAQAAGALANGNYAQVLVYASQHSKNALVEQYKILQEKIGKKATCLELDKAEKLLQEQMLHYKAVGNITEVKRYTAAFRLAANMNYDYCR